ncbi:TPA: hypothetical protein O2Z46_000137 [Staphylococcus aureus]|uniref:hypothetical protein n=2 Tax=Staphylococcus aureus TaxID=1280 RepID=UPI0001DD950F|nr:hypothetical protein [Staphylococcus aureus]HDJ6916195.1 hypothetical protein [Staphylococcus aureus Sa_TPS3169]HDJ6919300.1 hypothetical protein [Staphylococcus aureus Sa_TPS3162]HDJ6927322.1 hypothetical protein [Staphylococcus aureus Sa_TPS3157]HDJ6929909.1 hypothetical protein [Staphylococcus aureus Sa_TPS3148]HDJ6936364.1 hypothetical protein [Staphylococcus aureus Sa_TPS3161]HDJ6941333.1 hypothetical protein [Staphylococcus aureus Sa_TPS3174]HDJ6946778.1 hypothetical protein [Staphy
MRIEDAYRKDVIITLLNNEEYEGFVTDYENEFESETGNLVVDIQTDFAVYSFDETVIKSIRLLK